MLRSTIGASCMAAALAAVGGIAKAGPEDDTLRWASDSLPSSIDYYQHTVREGIVLSFHIWDTLVYPNPETGEAEPHLAESWEVIDDTTIEFQLRDDVYFHNGEKMTADDVVFTIEHVTSNTLPRDIFFLEGAEKIDDYAVRVHLSDPFPPIFDYLANMVPIYPAEYYDEVGPDGMSREPIGTGPYRVTELSAGDRIVMDKFDDYFGGAKGQPEIGTLEFRRLGEFNTQAVELMTGDLDWIWRVPPDARDRLEGADGIEVDSGGLMRVAFMPLDAAGRNDADGPLTDLNVRRAINHAIDREGIRAAMMGPGSELINVICAPVQFGCVEDEATVYEYDPDRARELLEEAGYEDGFSFTFTAYRDRQIAEAIVGDLNAVGITANLNYIQVSALAERRDAGELSAWQQAWGSYGIADVSAITAHFFSGNEIDYARDDRVTELLDEAAFTMDEEVRLANYTEALGRISDQAYTVPLFTYALTYAYIDALDFTPSPDETPRFYNARWRE